MEFEWDEAKAASNLRKHGVSFEVAKLIFYDLYRQEESEYVNGEQRQLTVGMVNQSELFIVYTVRDLRLRIISARRADSHERRNYWQDRLFHAGSE